MNIHGEVGSWRVDVKVNLAVMLQTAVLPVYFLQYVVSSGSKPWVVWQ